MYGRLAYARASGLVHYQGFTQSGVPIPHGLSGAVISDYSVRLGTAFETGRVMALPFVQYGHHAWRRLVGARTSQSYQENYQHDYMAVGGLFQVAMTKALVGSVYAMAGETLHPSIAVPALGFAQSLGTSPLIKAGALLSLQVSGMLGLYAAIRYTRFSYGQSAPQQSGNLIVMEPQSNTTIASYEGGFRFLF